MVKMIRLLLGMSLLFSIVQATPAHTATQRELNEVATVTTDFTPVTTIVYTDGRRCGGTNWTVEGKNIFGSVMWRVSNWMNACSRPAKGVVISKTYGTPYCWTAVWSLWHCDSVRIEEQSGQTLPRAYVYRQWKWKLHWCEPIYVWCKDARPWVYLGARGNGTFGQNGGV